MVKITMTCILSIIVYFPYDLLSNTPSEKKALILQEMSWVDVESYLKQDDMVIIPMGSTEQHGPHLPLGSDYFEAFEISKKISERTGVLIAPILMVGYSRYHSGFPGTLSIKPETMEQVVFENVEMLIQYGFRRFLLFNQHGGNNIVQNKLVHRINHNTEAIAIPIGVGSAFEVEEDTTDFFDWHAGKSETSMMLYLMPQLVQMGRAEKPKINFTSQMKKLRELSEENPDLIHLWDELFGVPEEAKKGGASHQVSNNGIWSLSDPKSATKRLGEQKVNWKVHQTVKFIEAWNRSQQ